MADYLYDNDPKDTYKCLLCIGNLANPGLHATTQRTVWTDDGAGGKTDAPFTLASDAMLFTDAKALEFRQDAEKINSSTAGQLDIDASSVLEFTAPTIELAGATLIDLQGDDIKIGEGGDADIVITFNANSNNGVLTWMEDEDHFKFSDDLLIDGAEKLYFFDIGGEYLSSDGDDLTIAAGRDIKLTAANDIHIPKDVGLTFDSDNSEKIESDDTDLTITSGGAIKLNAATDIKIPANIGLTFDTTGSEKIESDDTDLTVASGGDINLTATNDINIPASVGLTFGADTEKIEQDGSNNLSIIAAAALTFTAAATSIWSTSAGNLTIDSLAGNLILDGHTGVDIDASNSGAVNIDGKGGVNIGTAADYQIDIDASTFDLDASDNLAITMSANDAAKKIISITASNSGAGTGSIVLTADGKIEIKSSADDICIGSNLASGKKVELGKAGETVSVLGDCDIVGTLTSGTYAPDAITVTHASDPIITIYNTEQSNTKNDRHCKLIFQGITSGATTHQLASIIADHDSSDADKDGGLYFYTNDGADVDDSLTERLYIDHAGNAQFSTNIGIPATSKLYFDGKACSGNTYIYESGADALTFVAGGESAMILDANSRISLSNNDNGTGNTLFGYQAGENLDAGSNDNTFIGENVSDAAMNDALGNTGIGANCLTDLTTGDYNNAFGNDSLGSLTTGDSNVAMGYNAGNTLTTGSDNTYIGDDATASAVDVSNEMALGHDAAGQGANTIMLGDANITSLCCYDTTISSPSDKRIKREIKTSDYGLDFINALRTITYKRKNPFDYPNKIKPDVYKKENAIRPEDNDTIYVGLVAQEVENIMKKAGYDFNLIATSPKGMKSIKYGSLIMPIIKALQELDQKVNALLN